MDAKAKEYAHLLEKVWEVLPKDVSLEPGLGTVVCFALKEYHKALKEERNEVPEFLKTDETRRIASLEAGIREVLNKHREEVRSNTPDYIQASLVVGVLEAFHRAVIEREKWYGRSLTYGGKKSDAVNGVHVPDGTWKNGLEPTDEGTSGVSGVTSSVDAGVGNGVDDVASRAVCAVASLVKEVEFAQEHTTKWIQAVGLASTLSPKMEVDVDNPLGMMQQVVKEVNADRQRLKEMEDVMFRQVLPLLESKERPDHFAMWKVSFAIRRFLPKPL